MQNLIWSKVGKLYFSVNFMLCFFTIKYEVSLHYRQINYTQTTGIPIQLIRTYYLINNHLPCKWFFSSLTLMFATNYSS